MTTPSEALHNSRIALEYSKFLTTPLPGITASPTSPSDLYNWHGHITGPPSSLYASQTFFLTITFPPTYPLQPLSLRFTSPIIHPNVSVEGDVALPELEEWNWSPVQTVGKVLLCLRVLLSEPDPWENVLNDEAAEIYREACPTAAEELKARKKLEAARAKKAEIPWSVVAKQDQAHVRRKVGEKVYVMKRDGKEGREHEALTDEREREDFVVRHAHEVGSASSSRRDEEGLWPESVMAKKED